MYKKSMVFGLISLIALPTYARYKPLPIDKVSFVVNAEQWVKTDTAKLVVTINATLTKKSLVEMRQQIMKNLNTIAKGDWHITQFSRSQDNSGLERLYVQAENRVNQSVLPAVNQKAKSISQPGTKYQVSDIDFKPSDQDIEAVKAQVRQDLYSKIDKEAQALNNQFNKQKYSLYNVQISVPGAAYPQAREVQRMAKANIAFAAAQYSSNISVSNKVKLIAYVTLASNRDLKDD